MPADQPKVFISLNAPRYYVNRELSWLEFNARVLDEAFDTRNPLLERLKFLCIVSSNLDEFFEVRVAGLKQQKENQSSTTGPDGISSTEQLKLISERVQEMVARQYRCWSEELLPALEKEQIRFPTYPNVADDDREYLQSYFEKEVYPVLTPLAIDPVHPFPVLLNKSLNVVVELMNEGEEDYELAVVQVPRILPRVVPLPRENEESEFVWIGHIIQHHVGDLFHGMKLKGAHQFRLTRNSDLYIDEEEAENLLQSIETELRNRNRGNAVRLEVQADCPKRVADRLLDIFKLEPEDLYPVDGPINFPRLFPVISQIDRPDLKFRPYIAPSAPALRGASDLFAVIRRQDVLLHHPYESFHSVVDFIGEAAEDPRVLAIKQTLYRTSGDSPIVASLIEAAENGKQVTAVVELKARFDEAANIKWARVMQEAGIHVVFGLVGMKTHAKLSLVVRREEDGIRRYVHLGTGNYHPATAKIYTDLGLLTAREDLANDCAELFNLLTGVSKFPGMQKLLVAPWTLHEEFIRRIDRQAIQARAGEPCGITAKMNSLVDEEIIQALYRASRAGVPIRLIVRGICCLRPGLPGISDNIEVRSIVGQYLEHSRVFAFRHGEESEVWLASADWMPRNFFRRVETCFPIDDRTCRETIERILEWHWKDNVKARVLQADGTHQRVEKAGIAFNSQNEFMKAARQASRGA